MTAALPLIPRCTGRENRHHRSRSGAVLLEVVLALVLFVGAAAVLTSGLSSSLDALERLRIHTHAADLAVTVLSELQLGIKTLAVSGPQPFDPPLEQWTWEAVSTSVQSEFDEIKQSQNIEVIIRHHESPVVYRLSQILPLQQGSSAAEAGGETSF